MSRRLSRSSNAFTLIELLIVIAIIGLLVAILLPALSSARRSARTVICTSNLRQMMVAHNSYANAFKGYIAAFNGRVEDPDFDPTHLNTYDLSKQAYHMLVETTDRGSGEHMITPFDNGTGLTTHVIEQHSYFVAATQLDGGLLSKATVCPEDQARLSWRIDPLKIDESPYTPQKPINVKNKQWWPYSSSYQLDPATASRVGRGANVLGTVEITYHQLRSHDTYQTTKALVGGRKLYEVQMPAQKTALYDSQDRHNARRAMFFLYPEAKQPIAFYDGSVSMRLTGDANTGEDRAKLNNRRAVAKFAYDPDLGFEPDVPERKDIQLIGYYRWTSGNLGGIDFAGEEIKRAKP